MSAQFLVFAAVRHELNRPEQHDGAQHSLHDSPAPFPATRQVIHTRVLGRTLADEDPTGPLIQTHHEIRRLIRLYGRLVAQLPPAGPQPEDLRDLRRALYGLHAILTLHFAQEEELYTLFED